MLPRLSYLPVVADKVRKHFQKHVSSELREASVWFEDANGTPMRWHLPIGVLYDLATNMREDDEDQEKLPWPVTVRFGPFPKAELIQFEGREDLETFFMASVKEADQLKRQGRVVSAMQKKDHVQLWQGLFNDKFDQFWAVNRRLMEPSGGGDDCSGFKHAPVRLFGRDGQALPQILHKTADNDQQRKRTLKDLIQEVFPEKEPEQVVAVTHGVRPALDTPLQWLAEHLSYPDNFLYIQLR